jgi:hypothetical protein
VAATGNSRRSSRQTDGRKILKKASRSFRGAFCFARFSSLSQDWNNARGNGLMSARQKKMGGLG